MLSGCACSVLACLRIDGTTGALSAFSVQSSPPPPHGHHRCCSQVDQISAKSLLLDETVCHSAACVFAARRRIPSSSSLHQPTPPDARPGTLQRPRGRGAGRARVGGPLISASRDHRIQWATNGDHPKIAMMIHTYLTPDFCAWKRRRKMLGRQIDSRHHNL